MSISNILDTLGRNARSIIAFQVVTFSFAFLFVLLMKSKEIPANNATTLNVAAGVVLGVVATVCAYYFGSSKDKSDADKADMANEKIEVLGKVPGNG
jgi:succinate-acetate transporter protein